MFKTFIERLTDEQILCFLEKAFPEKELNEVRFDRRKDQIYATIIQNKMHFIFNFTLEDYDVYGWGNGVSWLKYLYEIFGEEYKQAFMSHVAKIFD